MSDRISSFFRRAFTESNQQYSPVDNQSSLNLPGAFPGDEAELVVPNQRAQFNSESLNETARNIKKWINIIFIRPLIIVLVICFRLLAKLLSIVYFKDQVATASDDYLVHNDSINKVNKFIRDLEDSLTPEQLSRGTSSMPPFYEGSYTQALYIATNRAKFLFVYLTNPHNESSSSLFKKIITNPKFIDIFNKNKDVLIWGGDLTNPEAYQLANSLNVTKFPFLGLLCLTRSVTMSQQGPIKTSPKISLVLKIQGGIKDDVDENALMRSKFQKKIVKYEGELGLIRNELRDRYMGQLLQKQQELNYENSLAIDRAKKLKKAYEQTKKKYLEYKSTYINELMKNPQSGDQSKIAIKMKSGARPTFNFPAGNPVSDIFLYVELYNQGLLNTETSGSITETEAQQLFANFEMKYEFKLVSPLPPRTNLNEMMERSIREIDVIYPNGLLIVEDM
ncbi:uncharacterized protein CANTADRAFT_54849 [Suhomyces tanzawaensis NRRL Y-17324]|uniref:UBX domain-containing protein n=1 Tax=Suhomyces tanzawaensis NRRL Y-17324 TaxID=984487 RepID=A0A1E4SF60_9ASCO|nr:uncharacterized protein CANTADRAFT_54849 [Suhomyces tanzawaensis NRRL Y-17324]ODV78151.1 hypothetical protein CANTADRAFT_54849 [Suhomyces tanzawaensis NRRL Y-17324]